MNYAASPGSKRGSRHPITRNTNGNSTKRTKPTDRPAGGLRGKRAADARDAAPIRKGQRAAGRKDDATPPPSGRKDENYVDEWPPNGSEDEAEVERAPGATGEGERGGEAVHGEDPPATEVDGARGERTRERK
jgi:hypothetical protein